MAEVEVNPRSVLEDDVTGDSTALEVISESIVSNEEWLRRARNAYTSSTDWVDANLRPGWERSIKSFHGQHAKGSKYQSKEYRKRSRIFRPKTRSSLRKGEAAVAAAFFATHDAVSVRPNDDTSPFEVARARIWHSVLNYRLTRTIPWFRVCLGAYQDASVTGYCCSKQYWRYEEDEFGNVIEDRPVIELLPPENVRFDPGADWLDPVESSPYFIGMFPIYLGDARAKIEQGVWLPVEDSALLGSGENERYDSTRNERERRREDKYDRIRAENDHEIVWAHENIMREGGQDWVFWTAGTRAMLTEPLPLDMVYPLGERPYKLGNGLLEAHRATPASRVEITQDLQTEANDIANLRLDNIKLSLMPLTKVRQGVGVDIQGLVNRVPGKVISVTNPESDIVEDRPPDVTGGAFAEQDRINVDFDELAGSFSTSSIASNRKLNETVGGMSMLNASASAIVEYDMRVFAETWVEPVLRQVLALEQAYETDDLIMKLAAKEAKTIWPVPRVVLEGDVNLEVNVGIGATNPMEQLGKFQMGADLIGKIFGPPAAMRAKFEEVVTEIFGKLGYKDGMRFFHAEDDPNFTHLTAALEDLTKKMEAGQSEAELRRAVAEIQGRVDITEQQMEDDTRIMLKKMDMLMEAARLRAGSAGDQLKAQTDVALQEQKIFGSGIVDLGIAREKNQAQAGEGQRQAGYRAADQMRAAGIAAAQAQPTATQTTQGGNANTGDAVAKAMLDAMQRLSEAATMLSVAAQNMSGPKEIVRDQNGKAVGIRPG